MSEPRFITWPLVFRYRGPVLGNGFLALVSFTGRALAEQEPAGVWLSGINPGGVAGGGCDVTAAQTALGRCVTDVLIELATEADSFGVFQSAVETFFHETDEAADAAWSVARDRVRATRLTGEALGLETVHGPQDGSIQVLEIRQPADARPEQNYEPEALLAA